MTDPLYVEPPPPERLDIETSVHGTVAQVAIAGDVDLRNVHMLEQRIRQLLHEQRISRLVLDLRRTTFLDSMGMALLLQLYRDAGRDHWRLIVVRGPKALQKPMEIAGLERLLDMVDDPADALEP